MLMSGSDTGKGTAFHPSPDASSILISISPNQNWKLLGGRQQFGTYTLTPRISDGCLKQKALEKSLWEKEVDTVLGHQSKG